MRSEYLELDYSTLSAGGHLIENSQYRYKQEKRRVLATFTLK